MANIKVKVKGAIKQLDKEAVGVQKYGVEIRDVADILGHKNIEITENYYISSSDESRKEANDIFEKVIHSDIIDKISNYKY